MIMNIKPGKLYVVATPIGHMDDLTPRARQVLSGVGLVLAEDTRVSANLLRHIGARPEQLWSFDQYREETKLPAVLAWLQQGNDVALISDAGTPAISDPGASLVKQAHEAGVTVVPIPGCSALAALLSVAGLEQGQFVFEGFLPAQTRKRQVRLARWAEARVAVVIYEAPHRVLDLAADLEATWPGDAIVVAGREMTKLHEEIWRGTVKTWRQWLQANPMRAKGEYAIALAPEMTPAVSSDDAVDSAEADAATTDAGTIQVSLEKLFQVLVPLLGTKRAAKAVAQATGLNKDDCYQRAQRIKDSLGE